MGALLDATAEIGEWSVEVRQESASLAGTGFTQYVFDGAAEPRHAPRVLWDDERPFGLTAYPGEPEIARAVAFAIPAEDARQVLAALDQILDHPSYRQYTRTQPPRAGVWRGERGVDLIRLYGPVVAVGSHKPWAVHHSVELEYRNTARWPICASP